MATDRQQQAAAYLRNLAAPSQAATNDRYFLHQRVHQQIEAGVMAKVLNVGKYAAHIVDVLKRQDVDTDIELDVVEMGPSPHGWTPASRYAIGAGWILRETPQHFMPEHMTPNSSAIDYAHNEVITPPHMEPAYGWALLPDATAAPYYRDKDRGEIASYGGPNVFRFNEFYLPSVGPVFNTAPGKEESLAILTVCGVDDPETYVNFVSSREAQTSRAADSWTSLLDRFVDRKGLHVSNP